MAAIVGVALSVGASGLIIQPTMMPKPVIGVLRQRFLPCNRFTENDTAPTHAGPMPVRAARLFEHISMEEGEPAPAADEPPAEEPPAEKPAAEEVAGPAPPAGFEWGLTL